jgi:hypothetical protein
VTLPAFDNRKLFLAAVAWTVAVTTARAVRLPNDFSTAHWLIDYRFGPLKRGVVGSLVWLGSAVTGRDPSAALIDGLSLALAAVTTLVFVYVISRLVLDAGRCTGAVVALAAACSPWMVMHAHLAGYFDGLIAALTVAAVHLALRGRAMAGAAVMALAMLVHEATLLVTLPAFLLAARRGGASPWSAAVPPVAAFAALSLTQTLLPLDRLIPSLQARLTAADVVDPELARLAAEWLTQSFQPNFAQNADGIWERAIHSWVPIMVAPSVLVLAWLAVRRIAGRTDRLLVLAACAAPQIVHLFAWDASRIWTWSGLAALLTAWVAAETADAPAGDRESGALRIAGLLAVVLGVAWTVPLMDSRTDHVPWVLRWALYLPTLAAAALAARGRWCPGTLSRRIGRSLPKSA